MLNPNFDFFNQWFQSFNLEFDAINIRFGRKSLNLLVNLIASCSNFGKEVAAFFQGLSWVLELNFGWNLKNFFSIHAEFVFSLCFFIKPLKNSMIWPILGWSLQAFLSNHRVRVCIFNPIFSDHYYLKLLCASCYLWSYE